MKPKRDFSRIVTNVLRSALRHSWKDYTFLFYLVKDSGESINDTREAITFLLNHNYITKYTGRVKNKKIKPYIITQKGKTFISATMQFYSEVHEYETGTSE